MHVMWGDTDFESGFEQEHGDHSFEKRNGEGEHVLRLLKHITWE